MVRSQGTGSRSGTARGRSHVPPHGLLCPPAPVRARLARWLQCRGRAAKQEARRQGRASRRFCPSVSGAAPQPVSPRSPLPGAWCPTALGTCRRLACKTTFSLSRKRKHLVACGAVPCSSKRRQGEGRPRLLVTGGDPERPRLQSLRRGRGADGSPGPWEQRASARAGTGRQPVDLPGGRGAPAFPHAGSSAPQAQGAASWS